MFQGPQTIFCFEMASFRKERRRSALLSRGHDLGDAPRFNTRFVS